VLEQTFVGAVPGRTYTFKGDVFIQDGYSGIVNTLNPLFPRGDYNEDTVVDAADYTVWRNNLGQDIALPHEGNNITPGMVTIEDYDFWKSRYGNAGRAEGTASPTQTLFTLEFLTSSDVLLATHTFNLRDDPTTLAWRTNQVQGVAPATTNKVRVRVSALDMVDNCCDKGQDVMFDNFSLRDSQVTGLERLTNGNLNTPGEPLGWTLFEGPTVDQGSGPVTADSAAFIGFANRRIEDTTPPIDVAGVPTGNQGLWLRSFVNTTQFNPSIPSVDAIASQVVPGTPGADYTFSAWSAWEQGYSGGLNNTSTQTFLRMEFLNSSMAVIGNHLLDLLAAGQMNDDGDNGNANVDWADWRQARPTCGYRWEPPACSTASWASRNRRSSTRCR
jgi:L-ascorbate metabolism protein UlaG (beta-lactamase superfamily)